MYQRNAALLKEKFGFDFTEQPVEVVPEMYEHSGEMLVDENAMCIDVEACSASVPTPAPRAATTTPPTAVWAATP